MSLWKIAWRSIEQRRLASLLTGLSMALGVALVVSVLVLYGVIRRSFDNNAEGYNIVVGTKGSGLELVLNTVFHLGTPREPLPYSYYKEFTEGKFSHIVEKAVPYCLGDNYQGYRVVGTVPEMFEKQVNGRTVPEDYAYGRPYRFAKGGNFQHEHFFEAVIGSLVARRTGLDVGSTFEPTHGVADDGQGHVHDPFKVVGVLEPTGTPNDRALFINIEGFYLLSDHAKELPAEPDAGAAHSRDDGAEEADSHGDHAHDDHAHGIAGDGAEHEEHGDHEEHGTGDAKHAEHEHPEHEDEDHDHADHEHADHEHADHEHAEHEDADHEHADHEHAEADGHDDHADHAAGGGHSADDDHRGAHGSHPHGDPDHGDHDHGEHDHGEHAGHSHHEPLPEAQREVTAILLRTGGGTANMLLGMDLPRQINEGQVAQAVMPAQEIDKLFNDIVGHLRVLLLALALLVVVVAGIGIMVSIYNSMSDRRRDIAVMRSLGASRMTVFMVILAESVLLSLAGGLAGLLMGHGLIWMISPFIMEQTGVPIGLFAFDTWELLLVPGLIVLAALAGYLPALTAYRTDVSRSLSAQ